MKSEALQNFPHILFTCVSLVLFLSVFLLVAYRTYSKKQKSLYTYVEAIPFEGEDNDR